MPKTVSHSYATRQRFDAQKAWAVTLSRVVNSISVPHFSGTLLFSCLLAVLTLPSTLYYLRYVLIVVCVFIF